MISKYGADYKVPCGKCICCRASKAKEWAQRLKNEQSQWEREGFLTLTYDDDNLKSSSIIKSDLVGFFKRLRYYRGQNKIKYFACGEYGEHTWRPHYHAIIFGMDTRDIEDIKKAWTKGERITLDPVLPGGIEYVTGYVRKKIDIKYSIYKKAGLALPFQLQSQGLGLAWAEKNKKILESRGLTREGNKIAMPRYYMRKLKLNGNEYYTELASELEQRDQELLDQGFDYDDINDLIVSSQKQAGVHLLRKNALFGHS